MSLAHLIHDDHEGIVLMTGYKSPDNGEDVIWNEGANTCDAAERLATVFANKNQDVYLHHGLHDGVIGSGSKKDKPTCRRENFQSSRSFFLDCDIHGKTGYANAKELFLAFSTAISALHPLGLPIPNVVQESGAGLQAVWVVDTPLPRHEWERLQRQFLLLFRKFGLDVDMGTQGIEKSVRFCGPPFRNYKHGEPRDTVLHRLDETRLDTTLFRSFVEANAGVHLVGSNAPAAPRARSHAYAEIDFTVDIVAIRDECKVLQHSLATGGAGDGYNHWIALLALCSRNKDEAAGRALAHELSCKHPEYSADETNSRFDGFRDANKGTTSCATLAVAGASLCATCRWREPLRLHVDQGASPTRIQSKLSSPAKRNVGATPDAPAPGLPSGSPIVLPHGNTAVVVQPDTAPNLNGVDILDGFYYNDFAGVRRKALGEEAIGPVVWAGVKISGVELRQSDISAEQQFLCFGYAPIVRNHYTRVSIDTARVTSVDRMVTALGEHNVVIGNNQHKSVQVAMSAWITQLQARQDPLAMRHSRLGWTTANSFVLGRSVYQPDRTVAKLSEASDTLRAHDPHGDQAVYMETIKEILQYEVRPEAHAFLAASLSSILLHLMGATGIALNWYSIASGYGKSTLALLAAAMWGNPASVMFTLDDTQNSLMRRLSDLNNLPAIYDEIRLGPHNYKDIGSLIFRLSSNTEKSRMETGGKVQPRGSWRTPILFATNYSFIDIARSDKSGRGGDAAVARVMDFRMPPLAEAARGQATQVTMSAMRLTKNNGWTGHQFVRYVVENQATVEKALHETATRLFVQAHRKQEDIAGRNHAFAGAAMIVAAWIASNERMYPISLDLVTKAVLTALDTTQAVRADSKTTYDPLHVMREYLTVMDRHRVTTISTGTNRIDIDISRIQPIRPFLYEVRYSDSVVIVGKDAFRRWLEQQGFPVGHIMEGLSQYEAQRSLCRNVKHMSQPVMDCYEFGALGIFENYFKD